MRRFITYLYEYDRGNRGKNCGFIRVDVRERDVQMEVNMRNCLRCGEKGTIYILVKNQDEILGIEMATLPIISGKGERTISFETKNIKESGYRFEQIIGIAIRCENGGYLASNWRDDEYEALTWGNFSIIYPKEMTPSPEEKPMPIPEYVQEEIKAFKPIENNREHEHHPCVYSEVENIIEAKKEDNINQSSLICSENDTMQEIKLENKREDENSRCSFLELEKTKEDHPSKKICSEMGNIEEIESENEQEADYSPCDNFEKNNLRDGKDCSKAFSILNDVNPISYDNICENSNNISTPESYENRSTIFSQKIVQNFSEIKSKQESTIFENKENPSRINLSTLCQNESKMNCVKFEKERMQSPEVENPKCHTQEDYSETQPLWQEQFSSLLETAPLPNPQMQYPCRVKSPKLRNSANFYSINTIEQPKVKRCSYKKITVSDIRNLPSPNWYLCNNNFLLHGFFNYNYLIIKTEKIEDKEKLYLGVPGIFEKQEKVMAMMFGFMYFESCSQEELDLEEEFEQSEDKKQPKEGDFGCWYLVLNN